MAAYTLDLSEIGVGDQTLAGGKGAGLGGLIRAGLPVPNGFVVTTTAYTDFLDAAGLAGHEPQRLHARIPREPVPPQIATAVVDAYQALGASAVAVRSSGTAEDLADASFAGQHDTYLDVAGDEAVLAAVQDCWASLWTPRAVDYRRRRGFCESGLALAVVVQTMVDAEWAGVIFTADPVTGRRDRVVIEAVPGLGEALVSGEATGHRHLVDKTTGRPLTPDSALPAGVLGELSRLSNQVEAAFGRPQDIEWVYAAGRCSLVQARPLTGLPAETDPSRQSVVPVSGDRRQGRLQGRGRGNHLTFAADHIPHPPYPMDRSLTLRPAARAILGGIRSAGFTTPDPDDVLVEIDDGVVQVVPPRIRPTPRALVRVPAALPKLAALLRTRPAQWQARCDATLVPLADRTDGEDLTVLSDRELIDRVEELRRTQGRLMASRFGCLVPRALLADRVLVTLLRAAVGPQRAEPLHTDLMSAIPCISRDARTELDRLAGTIRRSPELRRIYAETDPADVPDRLRRFPAGRALLAELDAYLRRYGHRQSSVPLAGFPPLRETPEVAHRLLGGLSRGIRDDLGTAGEEERVERARAELTGGRDIRVRVFGPLALGLLTTVRDGVAVREDSHFYLFMVVSAVIRRVLLEVGRRRTDSGLLDDPADVFYLEMEELWEPEPSRVREIVARRRAAREAAASHYTMFPAELLHHDRIDDDAVRGVPASRGTAVGRVRIIRGEDEFGELAAGEILVCPYTNPAWTPLFSLAAAVVADAGGAASHAAIVAREYGIPAVMGTGHGTRVLSDGQSVVVDGDTGTVVPHPRP